MNNQLYKEHEIVKPPIPSPKIPSITHHHPKQSSTIETQIKREQRSRSLSSDISNKTTIVRILSATYGPCYGRKLINGQMSHDDNGNASLPFNRDVMPIMRTLLMLNTKTIDGANIDSPMVQFGDVRIPSSVNSIYLLERMSTAVSAEVSYAETTPITPSNNHKSKSIMNEIFGDPCLGTTKKLTIQYQFLDEEEDIDTSRSTTIKSVGTFMEYEEVVLKRNKRNYQNVSKLRNVVARVTASASLSSSPLSTTSALTNQSVSEEEEKEGKYHNDKKEILTAVKMGRSQSISEMIIGGNDTNNPLILSKSNKSTATLLLNTIPEKMKTITKLHDSDTSNTTAENTTTTSVWRLRSGIAELTLPMISPYLKYKDRVKCQQVCKVWHFIIREHIGVATSVDMSDPCIPTCNRQFLLGIMTQSYSSLRSLYLAGFQDLLPQDFAPALPHLRKLQTLDISRCVQLGIDSTLILIAQTIYSTLEVLYLKGLTNATDVGMVAVCESCKELKVLEVSQMKITDRSGLAIGNNLKKLEALYFRDNYQLTNASLDVLASKCTKLAQLTLWGCIRLKNIGFQHASTKPPSETIRANYNGGLLSTAVARNGCEKLVLLNLWGCYNLSESMVQSMSSLQNLKTLVLSECHKLQDSVVLELCQTLPNIQHLHLRYIPRITDMSVLAIADYMKHLRFLDLSFCQKVSAASIVYLLENRYQTLTELRLTNCSQIDISMTPPIQEQGRTQPNNHTGRAIMEAIRLCGDESNLYFLDMRNCWGGDVIPDEVQYDHIFIEGMQDLKFEMKIPGLFVRKTRWNRNVCNRLIGNERFLNGV